MHNKKEPLIRISKRHQMPTWKAWLIRGIAVVFALLVNALFIFLTAKVDPVSAYSTMFKGAFGNEIYLWSTLKDVAKLLCIAIALAPAFKMHFWNIGAEGQLLIGALVTAIVMRNYQTLPSWLLFLLMFVTAAIGGAIWGIIPAVFKAKWDTNETLFTLMMNYIAIQLVNYFYNRWKGDHSSLGMINKVSKAGWFPQIMGQRAFLNLVIVTALMFFMYFYLAKTKHGYEISVVGESQNTARYAGINVKAVLIRTMALSGLICGICGFMTVAGASQTISSASTGGGYGFTAIIVAWLAKFNSFYMAGISIFLVALEKGTALLADKYASFNSNASNVVIGVILFFVIGSEFFINYRLNFRKKEAE